MTRGFTLIEVAVAVAIMAVMSTLAWRGVDGLVRAHEFSTQRLAQVQRVNTALAQLDADLATLVDSPGVPSLAFDGASLRWVREHEGSLIVVVWSARSGSWWRWASPPLTQQGALRDAWALGLRLTGGEREQLEVLQGLGSAQAYFYRRNAWSHAQSSGDVVPEQGAPVSPDTKAKREELPGALRFVLNMNDTGSLTRDWALGSALR